MTAVAIVGAQWGDEGKGKIVDIYTEQAEVVVRYAGGPNAGHTLVVDGAKVVVRLLPSGVLRRGCRCVIGQGMVVDPRVLVGELDQVKEKGYADVEQRLLLSERAHIILPYHITVDGLRESAAGKGAIGTTKKGIGPAYEDKARRNGIRAGELRRPERLKELVAKAIEGWRPELEAHGETVPSAEQVVAELMPFAERLIPLLGNTARATDEAVKGGQRVLLEGAQGTLLDIDHGTYPFVTSSNASAGGAAIGAGIGPNRIGPVVGITKAYTTRVGAGPFPTELFDKDGDHLRDKGHEYGSVTGRPRRTGWLDLPALRYAARVNGVDGWALTKLDVLTGLDRIRVCVAYDTAEGRTDEFPIDLIDNPADAVPVYRDFPVWTEDLTGVRKVEDLPKEARDYIDFICAETGVPAFLLSVGPDRVETIVLRDPFAL